MGNSQSVVKINYESLQSNIKHKQALIVNTLSADNQRCLIYGTLPASEEEQYINHYLKTNRSIKIIIYGMNSCDETLSRKYNQLLKLGFTNIAVYVGGLFEWLLLQEIYGEELFPTTTHCTDLLKYKGKGPEQLLMLRI